MLYLTKAAALAAATAALATGEEIRTAIGKRPTGEQKFTAEESQKYDKVMADYDAAMADVKLHEKDLERKKEFEQPKNRLPAGDGATERKMETGNDVTEDVDDGSEYSYLDRKSQEFKFRYSKRPLTRAWTKNFRGVQLDEPETKALGEWATRSAAITRKFSSLQDRDGGLATPPEVRTEVIQRIRDLLWIRSRATVITTQRESVMLPTLETGSPTTTRVGEKTTVSVSSITNMLGRQRMVPTKRLAIVKVPRELLEDEDFPLVDQVISMYSRYTGEEEEVQFLTGSGNGEPLGIFTALAGTSSEVDIAGSTTALVPEDIMDAVYRLHAQYRKRASWTLHRLVIAAIRKMRDLSGGAGTGQWMWQPGLQAGEPDRLVGYPLLESEYVPNPYTGADGDPMLLFGDWSTYYICDRTNLEIVRDDSIYRATDEVGYFIRRRYDGMPTLASPWVRVNRK